METLSALLFLYETIHRDRDSLADGQHFRAAVFSLLLAWIRRWTNGRVAWWRHQMEAFSALLAICAGNSSVPGEFPAQRPVTLPRNWPFVRGIHRSPVNSPHKGQWRWALVFSVICVWINGWVNIREVCDFRRYRAHYDVIVMSVNWDVMTLMVSCGYNMVASHCALWRNFVSVDWNNTLSSVKPW